jgi:hypothetical protein
MSAQLGATSDPSEAPSGASFGAYGFTTAYDEMFAEPGVPRPHYQRLFARLHELTPAELQQRKQAADLMFLHQGITFTRASRWVRTSFRGSPMRPSATVRAGTLSS